MKDGILWHPKAWDEYSKWIVDRNITIAKKIVELTKDISKNGLLNGLGKPERLKYYKKAIYSRRITDEHRLVYILIECSPQHFIPNILKIFKGISARKLFLKHPEIKNKLWNGHLWNPSYFVTTVSENTEEQIKRYIQTQKEK